MARKSPSKNDFAQLAEDSRKRDEYWVALAIYDFLEQVHDAMEAEKITRTDLAARLNTSAAYISKIFRGETNFTLETMIKIARRVGYQLEFKLSPEHISYWTEGTRILWTGRWSGTSVEKFPSVDYGTFAAVTHVQTRVDEEINHGQPIPA